MKDARRSLSLPTTAGVGHTTAQSPCPGPSRAQVARRAVCALLGAAAVGNLASPHLKSAHSCNHRVNERVKWKPCGDKFFCTSIDAPLDHHNSSDPRTVSIAVVKMVANPPAGKERLGSIYINPGGPGGSGSRFAYDAGPAFQVLSGGQYDIIGWDPRGINKTLPSVSCFNSAAAEYLYATTAPVGLDLPVNFSSVPAGTRDKPDPHAVVDHLERQARLAEASFAGVYAKCAAATGDAIAYVGTEAVVRDLDLISRLIDGEDAKINYWGLSYGTVIGQYLTSIIAPERLGRILLDGVVDWEAWTTHSIKDLSVLADNDRVLETFAEACATAGKACALSHLGSAPAILGAIDSVINQLYHSPQSVPYVPDAPGLVARASHARRLAFLSAYSIKKFPYLAEAFADALAGNYTKIVAFATPHLDGSWADAAARPASTRYATEAVRCADQPPYSSTDPAPDAREVTSRILTTLETGSRRVGEQVYDLLWCHHWPASKSRYAGGFEMKDGVLETPVLIMNQRFDPITPLNSAKKAMANYGTNARLVEQNGTGHCAVGQASLCSAKIMRNYWLEGAVPEDEHSHCEVDELPFQPREAGMRPQSSEDGELLSAWGVLGDALYPA